MAESTIEWTNNTWNPTTGCTHVSKECLNCYAEKETKRLMHNPNFTKYSQGFDVVVEHPDTLGEPYKWIEPRTVFVNSMSDLFHKDISLDFIKAVFRVMNDTPQHTYQVLTKREYILEKYSNELIWTDNIWMGVSVGMQIATRRIKSLVNCGAKHKFLSIEPLIEEIIDIDLKGIDWVIVGGESGTNKSRPIKKEWVVKIKDECLKLDIPFFFKQWGKTRNNPNETDPTINKLHRHHAKGGCLLDGKLYLANPSVKDIPVPILSLFGQDYWVMDDYKDLLTIWELKTYLPLMGEDLYVQLKEDIKRNGLNDPIIYFNTFDDKKLVIEGHTRLTAAIELRLKDIPSKEVKENFTSLDDIKLWMVKHQFQRRNLSDVQKIQLALLSKDTIERNAKDNLRRGGKGIQIANPVDTNSEIARIAGVSRTSVGRYARVLNKASKSIIAQMNKGEISISKASNSITDLTERPKAKPKAEKKTPKYLVLDTIDDGKEKIKKGMIDCVVILEPDKIEQLSKKITNKMGVYFLK